MTSLKPVPGTSRFGEYRLVSFSFPPTEGCISSSSVSEANGPRPRSRRIQPVEPVTYCEIRENPDNRAISPNKPASSQVHADAFMGQLRAKTNSAFAASLSLRVASGDARTAAA